jgi:phosphomannomutase
LTLVADEPAGTPSPPQPSASASPSRVRPEAVRAYDIRGIYGVQVRDADAHALGLSYAAAARLQGLSRIGVGYDGRLSSPALETSLVDGLVAGGMDVRRVGLCPTPELGFLVRSAGLDGAVMVTASHNPPDENGFKVLLGCERVHGDGLATLVGTQGQPVPGGSSGLDPIRADYLAELVRAADGLKPLKIAWDCGNGATSDVVRALTPRLPGEHILLFAEVDGRFPNHHPDPAVARNLVDLQAAVLSHGCDLGVAFDGDGDRIGVVDDAGEIIWADQVLLFLAQDLLARRPGAAVVADVKSSRVLFDGVTAAGGRAVMAPSGYVLIREAMLREGALLAGELSGHVFFADEWDGTDDAVYAAIRVAQALGRTGASLSDFRKGLPATCATPELRIPCPEARKAAVVSEVAERLKASGARVDPVNGVRVDTDDGWWLLRASGTEPKLTCRAEASDRAGLERLTEALRRQLALSGVEAPGL